MRQSRGAHRDRFRCPACAYSLRGHRAGRGVRCPECGRYSTSGELAAAAARGPGFRWWIVPGLFVPGAVLVLLQHFSFIVDPGDAGLRAVVFVVLYPMAFIALRDQRGVHRGSTALILTVFLWLTNCLMTAAYPALAAA